MAENPASRPLGATRRDEAIKLTSRKSRTGTRGHQKLAGVMRNSTPRRPTRTLAERLSMWITIITAITAVAALILSIFTFVQSRRTPEVTMNLPAVMRIREDMFDIYLQPSFSVPSEYDQTATITSVQLEFFS